MLTFTRLVPTSLQNRLTQTPLLPIAHRKLKACSRASTLPGLALDSKNFAEQLPLDLRCQSGAACSSVFAAAEESGLGIH